jgi:hypothetical protein
MAQFRETASLRYVRGVTAALALIGKPAPSPADVRFCRVMGLSISEAALTLSLPAAEFRGAVDAAHEAARRADEANDAAAEPVEVDWRDPNAEHSTLNHVQQFGDRS